MKNLRLATVGLLTLFDAASAVHHPTPTAHARQAARQRPAEELRHQYAVGIKPPASGKKDGRHDIKVQINEVRGPGGRKMKLSARTRRGFYDAPAKH